jgi:hypothetical protein
MKTIIAGSRHFTNYEVLCEAIKESHFKITEIISGHSKGVDSMGERYAKENNIKLTIIPALWQKYGKAAGPMRNIQMAEYGNALIALPMNDSIGTKHMIKEAKKRKLKIYVRMVKGTANG